MSRSLIEILNEEKITDLGKDGTYIAVKFTPESADLIHKLAKSLDVDNVVDKSKYHITVVYSRKPFTNFTIHGDLKTPWVATPTELEIFETQSGSRALVLRLDCPKLVERHEYFKEEHGATYDFDEYKTHVTLSYDVGEEWQIPEDFVATKLFKKLEIGKEYYEPLNNDWASKSTEEDKEDKDMTKDKDKVVNENEETGCSIDDTCAMDTTAVLSDEKNKELMSRSLDSLRDLL